jgi:hypothetical protein
VKSDLRLGNKEQHTGAPALKAAHALVRRLSINDHSLALCDGARCEAGHSRSGRGNDQSERVDMIGLAAVRQAPIPLNRKSARNLSVARVPAIDENACDEPPIAVPIERA